MDRLCLLLQRAIPEIALDEIALEWAETLREIPDPVFVKALRRHRQQSAYWPTEAEILRLAGEIRDEEMRAQRRLALPEITIPTPEMLANNIAQAQKLLDKLAVNMAVRQ